ncbi:MAG: phosphatase PAP2 family protein, partial [Eudoraea sp.]|nr:phosphatase PAP2 family protein [Eudoraea sp.]NNJ40812.1 phosphatase PAP2 family protein [Eudoraea sp.]
PPFPEYTSGHSVVSGAAAIALTDIFGDNFAFDDDTEIRFGLPVRSFNSFNEAADEAAISRMYGGIHYRTAVEIGVKQGRDLGKFVLKNLNMKNTTAVATN